MKTITVLEKAGTNIADLVHSTPGMSTLGQMFMPAFNPHVSLLDERSSTDLSYVEFHCYFHDEFNYQAWHNEFGAIHDPLRVSAFEVLEQVLGVTINRYWDTTDLSAPGSRPMSEFVSKL
jgi:hypothetical protein